ncbi:hypothetical protein LVO79_20895 (plasmid) [Roseivivax marinus]|uniref:hypothetical protein n=1 Tax=Roseivivax marinus TaxID=1379903 RepID=UPI001F035C83|nr:hypothetical protein [Roseivivax marinus]UMA67236.1 hypothetical protein LVO79_20895 [Roseivivax marinus]
MAPLRDDGRYETQERFLRIYRALEERLWGAVEGAEAVRKACPIFIQDAGINSDCAVDRLTFERFLNEFSDLPERNRLLYARDCEHLVDSAQTCTREIATLLEQFYRLLNGERFFPDIEGLPDGVRMSSSPAATLLVATLGTIFIRLHSLLDYLTKLAFEAENLKEDFATYPKLASSSKKFGDRRHLRMNGTPGTFFEANELVSEIELVRNRLIHDGMLDDRSKVFERIENGKVTERFVLWPDRTDGRFDRYVNRTLFYGGEDKINLRLPAFVQAFGERQRATLEAIHQELS